MSSAEISRQQTGIFEKHPSRLKLCLVLMLLAAALIRWNEIEARAIFLIESTPPRSLRVPSIL
jgi:hypothetical protein